MAFFTKLKKAKGAAEEHKKAAASVKEEKPKVPYKHIPVHAAQDALSATPTTIRAEVLRERIEKARRTRPTSQSSNRTALSGIAMYQSVNGQPRSRPASIASAPSHSRQGSLGKRTNSDLSIASMMNTYPEAASRGRQPARRDHFAQDSGAPAVPPVPEMHRPKYSSTSSRSSVTKRRSPLSAMSISEDYEAEASSSSSQASEGSVASSDSSATDLSRPNSSHDQTKDINRENNYSRPLSMIAPVSSAPSPAAKKHHPVIEVSAAPPPQAKKSRWSMFSRKSMAVAAH